MKIQVLGCSGSIARDCRTTSFLLDEDVLIDAGTGVGDLSLDALERIDHILLTHSHLDHVLGVPLLADSVLRRRQARGAPPIEVHALPETLAVLRDHLFNNHIWPDFTRLPTADYPVLRFVPFAMGDILELGGRHIEVLSAHHSVPACGFAVHGPEGGRGAWVFQRRHRPEPAVLGTHRAISGSPHRHRDGVQRARVPPGQGQRPPLPQFAGRRTGHRAAGRQRLHHPHQAGRDRCRHGRAADAEAGAASDGTAQGRYFRTGVIPRGSGKKGFFLLLVRRGSKLARWQNPVTLFGRCDKICHLADTERRLTALMLTSCVTRRPQVPVSMARLFGRRLARTSHADQVPISVDSPNRHHSLPRSFK